jgi:ABC-type uncharacterized transport system substrate-binding protein
MTGMARRASLAWLSFPALCAGLLAGVGSAQAHPHVFVGVQTVVNYDGGKVASLSHTWTFDELYSAAAVEGLDKNSDGVFAREELAELAKVNVDAIKEVGYYTVANLGTKALKFGDARDYYLEHKDGILSLHFTLPLAEDVLAEAEGFNFSVYDESFYIYFDYADAASAKLGDAAPSSCKTAIGAAPGENADTAQLSDAFSSALGSWGASMAKTVTIACAKS